MLRFFRRLRLGLTIQNPPEQTGQQGKSNQPAFRAGRYLLYALGEIVLIVVGILLALYLDNINADAQARKVETELLADGRYQCPMDCEDGKHYAEAGSCPVCKMDLKKVPAETAMTCKMHENGKCKCDGKKCACANCKEHNKMQNKGQKKQMTCKMHEEGKCKCEGDKCACADCKDHS